MRRLLVLLAVLGAAGWAGWCALVRRSGDSLMAWQDNELAGCEWRDGALTATIDIENRGDTLGVVRRVEGRVVAGGSGRVLATLQGSRPPERGWWASNILQPGEACIAEIDVVPEGQLRDPVVVELTIQEMGRRVFQYRTVRARVPLPATAQPAPRTASPS